MERTRGFFEKDTRRLVEVVTGFKENDENFNLCLDFALSNFVSLKYVDEAWFKVRKRIEGLCERFHVHNQYEKANRLHALSSHFLNRLNELSIHEKNTGYSALSLLTYLCGSVESSGGSVCQSVDNEEEEEPQSLSENISQDVDWEKYLGGKYAESQSPSESDTESWSDSDDDSLTGYSLRLPYPPAPPSTDSGIEVTPDSAYASYPPLQSFQPYHEHESPKKPVQWPNRYWEPQYQTSKLPSSSSHSRTSFTKVWENHLANKDPVYTPETNLVLTEGIVMRELLWMLNGIKETYLFEWQGDHFTVKQHAHLSHLTEDTLSALLLPFCHFGKKAAELHSFISEVSSRSQTFARCQTLDAYAYGMEHFLVKYSSVLTSYEEKVVNQEETLTVIQLTSKLKPELDNLEFLYHIHTSIMQQIPENCTPSVAAVMVLDSLWKLLSAHGIWMDSSHFLQMLLVIFLVSVRPYVGMCESLVMRGQLTDPFSEFFIVKNQTASEDDGNFWNSVLMLREYPPELLSGFFFRPCFEDSLRAGRSMEVLSKLESYYKRDGLSEVIPDYLFTKFTETFQQFLSNFESPNNSLEVCDDVDKNVHQSHSSDSWFALPAEKLNPASKEKSLRDMYKNQFALCEKAKEVDTEYNKNFALCERTAKCVHSSLLRLPGDVVKHSLLSCIQTACSNSSNMLLNLLKEKHSLMSHFSVMKKYFLMGAGDVMFSFYTTIFDKIFDHIVWQNGYDLNNALKSCLILVDEEASEKLYIIVEEAGRNNEDAPLRQLDCMYMTYTVEWPINVILSPEIQDGYCQIFHFLLQIKCAKYNLDELHNNPLQQTARYAVQPFRRNAGKKEHQLQVIHGMHILRIKLLHFVNGFHSYIMTRILHSSGLELKEKLGCAKSVDDILIGHRQYLVSLFERCLLDSKLPYLREQIQRVLNLTLKFQAIWRSGLDRVWIQDLREIEQDFSSSMNFLTSYLKKRWKSPTGVHLDELAGAILTDTHTIHIFT